MATAARCPARCGCWTCWAWARTANRPRRGGRARWTKRPSSTTAVIGSGYDGPVGVDLVRDGPHTLIAGTTGSGKSELLQTLVASLAVANRPDELTFLLIDYKGGSAFKDCARLPHTLGMVTDLDGHLVNRALASLAAELRRRERLLATHNCKDHPDYQTARRRNPTCCRRCPRLILVDRRSSPRWCGEVPSVHPGHGLDRPARPLARPPHGAGHPAPGGRGHLRHQGQHQPADRAAGDPTRWRPGRDRAPADAAIIAAEHPGPGPGPALGHRAVAPFQAGYVGAEYGVVELAAPARAPWAVAVPWARLGRRPGPAGDRRRPRSARTPRPTCPGCSWTRAEPPRPPS